MRFETDVKEVSTRLPFAQTKQLPEMSKLEKPPDLSQSNSSKENLLQVDTKSRMGVENNAGKEVSCDPHERERIRLWRKHEKRMLEDKWGLPPVDEGCKIS